MVAILAALPAVAHATNYSVDPSMDYRAVLGRLGPGDTVTFAPGRYTRGFPVNNVNGTAAQPVLIAGPMSGARAIIEGRACCNTVSIRSSSHVHIRSFDLDGQGLAVDGVKAESDGGSDAYDALTKLAAEAPPGSEGLLFLPYLCS